MKRKLFITSVLIALSIVFSVSSVMAIDIGTSKTQKAAQTAGYDSGVDETGFGQTVGIGIRIALSFLGVVFLGLMVYAGYLWMTARGEEEQITKSQKMIIAATIGLIIVVGAYGITSLVVPKILQKTTGAAGGGGVGEPKVHCCDACGDWEITCPPKEQLEQKPCEAKGGTYLGKMPVSQCQ